jgi:hypothetical protein
MKKKDKMNWIDWIGLFAIIGGLLAFYHYLETGSILPRSILPTFLRKPDIIDELKALITEKGGYNNLGYIYCEGRGNIWSITLTKDIKSNKWEAYSTTHGLSSKESDVFELDTSNYLTLADFDLRKLDSLLDQSVKKVHEKGVKRVQIQDCEISRTRTKIVENTKTKELKRIGNISITIKPIFGGTDFKFTYDTNGNLVEFQYDKPIRIDPFDWHGN